MNKEIILSANMSEINEWLQSIESSAKANSKMKWQIEGNTIVFDVDGIEHRKDIIITRDISDDKAII